MTEQKNPYAPDSLAHNEYQKILDHCEGKSKDYLQGSIDGYRMGVDEITQSWQSTMSIGFKMNVLQDHINYMYGGKYGV